MAERDAGGKFVKGLGRWRGSGEPDTPWPEREAGFTKGLGIAGNGER